MQCSIHRRVFTGCLAAMQLLASIVLAVPSNGWAQAIDGEPPQVEIQPVETGIRNDSQVFTATVSDNAGVASVVLRFRLNGESAYEKRDMQALGDSDIYITTIEANDDLRAADYIQYYIEATDAAGNRTLEGFAFDPIERTLTDRQQAVNDSTEPQATESDTIPVAGMSTGRIILYGLLGAVVVGALAASSSGGGGGGAEPGVDVTIIVDPLP